MNIIFSWKDFPTILFLVSFIWILGAITAFGNRNKILNMLSKVLLIAGLISLCVFMVIYWIGINRPPFKTIAETRLWYAIFIALLGIVLYLRWKIKIVLLLSLTLALFFSWLNYFIPGNYDKTLMPALQSPWFIPHVIVYILGYALLGMALIVSLWSFIQPKKNAAGSLSKIVNTLVYIGFVFLTFGLMFGALWAKVAWGHYWTWDPKEIWALISWLVFLIYIHYSFKQKITSKIQFWILILASSFVFICWLGIQYLPAAQNSIHVY